MERRQARRVRWARVDRALSPFTPGSVVPLLSAAVDSPFLGEVRSLLWLAWVRAVRRPPCGRRTAGAADLPEIARAALAAYPALLPPFCEPADPRLVVRFGCGDARLRMHPGEMEHPLLVLRNVTLLAGAADPYLVKRLGFGLADVLELTLRVSDRYLAILSLAWPADDVLPDDGRAPVLPEQLLTEAEVAASDRARAACLTGLPDSCRHPSQAGQALEWLSRQPGELRIFAGHAGLSLGPVLAVTAEGGPAPVPAALMLSALLAASERLTALAARDSASRQSLLDFTSYRAEDLLRGAARPSLQGLDDSDAALGEDARMPGSGAGAGWDGQFPAFAGPAFSGVITSCLDRRELGLAVANARDSACAETRKASGRAGLAVTGPVVVVYGGPAGFASPVHDVACLHVEELAEMIADAEGDLDVVAQFLRELSSHPGAPELEFADILDVWWHWRDHKMIGPPLLAGERILVRPYEARPDWERAAALEPVEAVLAGAGLPECRRWPVVRMDEPGQATLLAPAPGPPHAVLVRADPPLVISFSLDDGPPMRNGPGSLFGLADGLRITAGRHPDIAAGLSLPGGTPLTILITFTPDRQPPAEGGFRAAGIGLAADPEGMRAGLELGPEFIEWLAEAPQEAHKVLGLALHRAISQLRGESQDEPSPWREKFMEAWESVPPVSMVRAFHDSAPAFIPPDPIPRGEFGRARARRAIAMALAADPPATDLSDRDTVAHTVVVTEAHLRARLGGCAPAVTGDIARAVNAAHAAYWEHSHELELALAAPWAPDWQAAELASENPAARLRPLELLIELLTLSPPRGDHRPDRYELAELAEVARALLEMRIRLNAMDLKISFPQADTDPGDDEDEPPDAAAQAAPEWAWDVFAYHEACARARVRIRMPHPGEPLRQRESISDALQGHRVASEFRPVASLDPPPHLLAADRELRASLGTGFDGLRAVLGTATGWPVCETGVAAADRESLASEAADWSRLPRPEIDAAVTLLCLDPQGATSTVGRYWEVERRADRLRMRPFPVIDGELWIMPWLAQATQELIVGYFADSRLPYPEAAAALRRHRQKQNQQLESDAAAAVRNLELPCRLRWLPAEARAAGMEDLHGEIDLIAADPATGRLWVCEIKDPEPAFAPAATRRHIERFTRTRGYIDKLMDNTRAVAANPQPAAAACGVTGRKEWTVIPLMVTRAVEPAAFIRNPRTPFTTLEDLPAVLQSDNQPGPGHIQIDS